MVAGSCKLVFFKLREVPIFQESYQTSINFNERSMELPEPLAPFFSFFPLKNCQPKGMKEVFLNKWANGVLEHGVRRNMNSAGDLSHRLIPQITDKLAVISLFCWETLRDL